MHKMINEYLLIIPIIASFFIALSLIPFWIRKAKQIGLVWGDMNKNYKLSVAGSGGIITVLSFLIGALLFVAYRVFFLKSEQYLIE